MVATTIRMRVTMLTLAVGVALHVPWLALSAIASAIGLLARPSPALREKPRRMGFAVGLGGLSGVACIPLVLQQLDENGFALPFEKPSLWMVLPLIVVAAAANGFGEETIWRDGLAAELGHCPPSAAGMIQSVSFGVAHYAGVPGGWLGAALATVFGLLAFKLKQTYGIWTAIAAHGAADLVLFLTVWISADALFVSIG